MLARGKGVQRETRGEVAEDVGERFYIHAILQRHGSERMPQIVEPDAGQSGAVQHAVKHMQDAVRGTSRAPPVADEATASE